MLTVHRHLSAEYQSFFRRLKPLVTIITEVIVSIRPSESAADLVPASDFDLKVLI